MKFYYLPTFFLIIFSFFSAIILSIIPLPSLLTLFYPLWVPLILIYWTITFPKHFWLTLAWFLGVIIDTLYGSYLGEHSLALCVVTFLAYRFQLHFRLFPLVQQILFIFFMLGVYQGVLIWIQISFGFPVEIRWLWVSMLISALVWPLMSKVLNINFRNFSN